MIRVLVAEDSAVAREYLVHLLSEDPSLQVVATARDGEEAIQLVQSLRPDVVLMDIHMPKLDGYEATRWIMEHVPTPIVMVSASSQATEAAAALEALRVGAVTVLEKPPGLDHPRHEEAARELVETVRLMAEVKVVRRRPARHRPVPPPEPSPESEEQIRLIAVGASTGGPQAVAEILAELPGDLGCPVLLVQHIAAGFTDSLARWLAQGTRLVVKVADAGERTRAGTVYLAPDGFQMGVARDGRIRFTEGAALNGFCPSASYLFQSVADSFGRFALGVLLSGMGSDGAEGLRDLRNAGGITIAQDEETSVVFGMPKEAIRIGAATHVLSPTEIARAIRSLSSGVAEAIE